MQVTVDLGKHSSQVNARGADAVSVFMSVVHNRVFLYCRQGGEHRLFGNNTASNPPPLCAPSKTQREKWCCYPVETVELYLLLLVQPAHQESMRNKQGFAQPRMLGKP